MWKAKSTLGIGKEPLKARMYADFCEPKGHGPTQAGSYCTRTKADIMAPLSIGTLFSFYYICSPLLTFYLSLPSLCLSTLLTLGQGVSQNSHVLLISNFQWITFLSEMIVLHFSITKLHYMFLDIALQNLPDMIALYTKKFLFASCFEPLVRSPG